MGDLLLHERTITNPCGPAPDRLSAYDLCYYFDSDLCWHNYCGMLNKIIMMLVFTKDETSLQFKMKKHYIKTLNASELFMLF